MCVGGVGITVPSRLSPVRGCGQLLSVTRKVSQTHIAPVTRNEGQHHLQNGTGGQCKQRVGGGQRVVVGIL